LPNTYTLVKNLDRYIKEYSSEESSFNILTIRVSEPEENYRFFNDDTETRTNIILEAVKRIDRSTKHKKLFSRTGIRVFTIVYLSKLSLYSMQALANTIIDEVTQPYYINSQEYNLVCNIGIASNEKNMITNAETLLQHAEAANHSAMKKGKNKIAFYDPDAISRVLSFNMHLDSIRQALKDKQFEIYYQPKVDLLQDKVIGLEALIRWRLPDGSILTPDQFSLNLMDNHPISMEIGVWVQHAVLQQAEKLIKEHFYMPISINISPYQLKQDGFATELETVLLKYPNVPGRMIILEILETAALDDLSTVNQIIKSCRPLGIKFSLDDFGTGYSSLAYLKELDIDEVKLDQSFIRDCIYQTEDMIVLKSTIDLCNMLGRQLIAEGVETHIHAKMLLNLGCPRMQGYAFARPTPAASIITWLKTWNPAPSLKQKRFSTAELESLIKQDIQHYINFNAIHYYLNDKNIPLIDFNYSSCKFGQWLTDHQHIFKNTTSFKRFDNLHKLIHKQAIEIIELANNGKEAQANSAFLKLIKNRRDFIYQLIKSVYEDD